MESRPMAFGSARTRERGRRFSARRSPRRGPSRGARIAVSFAPMIDVTFLLLIFFLVTTSFERAEGILTSRMANDSAEASVPLPLSPIVIRVTQTGDGHDDFSVGIDNFAELSGEIADLSAALTRIHQHPGFDKTTPVVIVAQGQVRWDHVVGCWNAAVAAGCERIVFGSS